MYVVCVRYWTGVSNALLFPAFFAQHRKRLGVLLTKLNQKMQKRSCLI